MSRIPIYVSLFLVGCILSVRASTVLFSQGYVPLGPPYTTTVVGVSSYSFGISLSDFNGAISLSATSTSGAVAITPSTFTFTSASSSFSFSYTSTRVGADTITWTISGAGAANYDLIPNTNIQVNYRNVLTNDAFNAITSTQLVVGVTYGPYSVSVDYAPPSGLTVTPTSIYATFTTALSFTSTASTAQFSFTPTQAGPLTISWTLTGANSAWYQVIPDLPLNIGYRTFTVVGPNPTGYIIGQKSAVYTVSTQYPPSSDVSLAISLTTTGCAGVTPVASTAFVAFSPSVYSSTFTITSSGICNSVVPSFTLAGTNQNLYVAPTTGAGVSFGKLSVSVSSADPIWNVGSALSCGNSAIVQLTVSAPPPSGFSVALSSPSATFSPSTLTFTPSTLSNTFTVTSTADNSLRIDYRVSGADANSVNFIPSTNIAVSQKNINTPSATQFVTPSFTSLLVGTNSAPVHVTLDYAPSSALLITPKAPGLTFTPPSLTFGPTITDQSFTVTGMNSGTYTIVYTVSGADSGCYVSAQSSFISISLLRIQVTGAYTTKVGALSNVYTVSIPGLSSSVTLTPASLDFNNNPQPAVSFSPPSLQLTAANPTTTFQLTATSVPANNQISFSVSGTGASQVSTTSRFTYTVSTNTFTMPTLLTSATSQFYAGTTSQPLIVTLSGTATSVNLVPTAPSTRFTPPVLSFTPTSLSQSFTITPLDAPAGGQTRAITWTVNGTDADGVNVPGTQSYVALLRPFVVDSLNYLSGATYIGTPVPFTVSTLYLPESPLTITPSGSFSISPSSITISADSPSASFVVTPTLAGQGTITFTVTGASSNYYAAISPISINTQQATITAFAPVNTASLYVGVPSAPVIVRLSAPPADDLIINVYSQQVAISPSTLAFSSTDTFATFTFSALPNAFSANTGSSQTIYIQYAVSGASASQYLPVVPSTISVIPTARSLVAFPTAIRAQIGVPVSFTVSTLVPTVDSLTITPYVPQVSNYYEISPASATLTANASSVSFTVTAISYPAASAENIVLSLSGPDANLFAAASNTIISVTPAFGSITTTQIPNSLPFGKPYSTYLTLTQTASESISVQPYVLFGQAVEFDPPAIEFTPGMTWAPFTITPQAPGFSRIGYTIGGDSAGIFAGAVITNDLTITQGSITASFKAPGLNLAMAGSTQTVTFTLAPPTANGLTLNISGTGLSFSPNQVTFAPGSAYATSVATALQNRLGESVVIALGGPDAPNYVNPCPTLNVCSSSSGSTTISASVSASSALQATITFSASSTLIPVANNIIITPSLPNVTFQPSTIALGGSIYTASTVAYSSSAGTQFLSFSPSGPGASLFTYTDQSTVPVVFAPSTITVTYPTSVFAGVTSSLITLTVANAPVAVVPAVQITPVTTTPGVVFSPSVMVIDSSQGQLSASFTYTYSGLGSFAISYLMTGPGVSAYAQIPSNVVANSLGTVEVPPTFPYNYQTNSNNFIYGVQSLPFTMFVRGVAGNLTVQPISDNFNFTPTQLVFSPTVNQATFTVLPTKVGPAVISFNLLGPSALLYARPSPLTTARVVYRITIPAFPRQTPGIQSNPQTISISPPTNTSFVVDLAASQGIIFNPSRLIFGPGVSSASYTIIAPSVSVARAVTVSIPGYSPGLSGSVATVSVTGRSADDNVAITYPLIAPVTIPVVPGYFFIQHPRYQMGVATKIRISASNTPRSDVTLSLVGNNMQFEPPYAIFQNGGPTEFDIKVTPLYASSYEVNYAPFKIDYLVSGTNAGDYANPTESYHYIALSQGYIAAIILMSLLGAIILIGMCLFFANKLPGADGSKTVNIN